MGEGSEDCSGNALAAALEDVKSGRNDHIENENSDSNKNESAIKDKLSGSIGGNTDNGGNGHHFHALDQFYDDDDDDVLMPMSMSSYDDDTEQHQFFSSRCCHITGCRSHKKTAGVTLHKFPLDSAQFNKWMHNTGIVADRNFLWRYRVCNLHFEKACFRGTRLLQGVVPTLNLGPDTPSEPFQNDWNSLNAKPAAAAVKKEKRPRTPDDDDLFLEPDFFMAQQTSPSPKQMEHRRLSDIGNSSDSSTRVLNKNTSLHCQVAGCTSHANQEGVILHKFPSDNVRFERWRRLTGINVDRATRWRQRICNRHFEKSCYRSDMRLYPEAEPTLYLDLVKPESGTVESEHDQEAYSNEASAHGGAYNDGEEGALVTCCVPNCGRIGPLNAQECRFFQFPKSKQLLSKWLMCLRMEYDSSKPWDYYICDLHFDISAFDGNRLNPQAVPNVEVSSGSFSGNNAADETSFMSDQDDDYDEKSVQVSQSFVVGSDGKTRNVFRPGKMRCSLGHCQKHQYRDRVSLFKLPKSLEQREKWVHNMNVEYDEDKAMNYRVCSAHFEKCCFVNLPHSGVRRVHRRAVPTLQLGKYPPQIPFTNHDISDDELFDKKNLKDENFDNPGSGFYGNSYDGFDMADEDNKQVPSDDDDDNDGVLVPIGVRPDVAQGAYRKDSHQEHQQSYKRRNDSDSDDLLDVMYEKKRYKRNAAAESSHKSSEMLADDALYKKMVKWSSTGQIIRCCLPHCRNQRSDTIKLFRFPVVPEVAAQWSERLRLRFNMSQHNTKLVCSEHFEPHLVGKKRLMSRTSLPTRKLGYTPKTALSEDVFDQGALACSDSVEASASKRFKSIDSSASSYGDDNLQPLQRPQPVVASKNNDPIFVAAANPNANRNDPQKPTKIYSIRNRDIVCSVPQCNASSASKSVMIFSQFPDDFEGFIKWCFNLKVDPRTYQQGTYHVCSAHFEPCCINGEYLEDWAVPTLYLGHAGKRHSLERPMNFDQQVQWGCSVRGCQDRKGQVFCLPENRNLRAKWCHNLKFNPSPYIRVCARHFERGSIRMGQLYREAVPTLHLGHNDTNIFPNKQAISIASISLGRHKPPVDDVATGRKEPRSANGDRMPSNDCEVIDLLDDDDSDDEFQKGNEKNNVNKRHNGNDNYHNCESKNHSANDSDNDDRGDDDDDDSSIDNNERDNENHAKANNTNKRKASTVEVSDSDDGPEEYNRERNELDAAVSCSESSDGSQSNSNGNHHTNNNTNNNYNINDNASSNDSFSAVPQSKGNSYFN